MSCQRLKRAINQNWRALETLRRWTIKLKFDRHSNEHRFLVRKVPWKISKSIYRRFHFTIIIMWISLYKREKSKREMSEVHKSCYTFTCKHVGGKWMAVHGWIVVRGAMRRCQIEAERTAMDHERFQQIARVRLWPLNVAFLAFKSFVF